MKQVHYIITRFPGISRFRPPTRPLLSKCARFGPREGRGEDFPPAPLPSYSGFPGPPSGDPRSRRKAAVNAWALWHTIRYMEKKKSFNLRMQPRLIAEMKIRAIREGRTIAEIAAELFREYLGKKKPKR